LFVCLFLSRKARRLAEKLYGTLNVCFTFLCNFCSEHSSLLFTDRFMFETSLEVPIRLHVKQG
jgi:hypothetical protein